MSTFPYDEVVAEFRRVGKHFVSPELLRRLAQVRERAACPQLQRFLDTALDKWDGRYDNPSYLALATLRPTGCPRGRDRLLALLLADTLRFELGALDGATTLQPQLRPDARTVAKRCGHAVRAVLPALERLGLADGIGAGCPLTTARRVCAAVEPSAEEARVLQLSMLPVSLVHDEHMFIRVLQSYEVTFALVAAELEAAVTAVGRDDGHAAAAAIAAAERALRESSPLWSLVATMQPAAFLTFREFTDGASAIQSRNYKRIESACRRPDRGRLDSPAYDSVPEVRAAVLAGRTSLDDALARARLTGDERDALHAAMAGFGAALGKWRQTHYRLAVRMLGDRNGTGHTAGQSYLDKARSIPVFAARCPMAA